MVTCCHRNCYCVYQFHKLLSNCKIGLRTFPYISKCFLSLDIAGKHFTLPLPFIHTMCLICCSDILSIFFVFSTVLATTCREGKASGSAAPTAHWHSDTAGTILRKDWRWVDVVWDCYAWLTENPKPCIVWQFFHVHNLSWPWRVSKLTPYKHRKQ